MTKKIDGITKIAVKGFKSIAEECTIEICPLTILAGANSSGKSSIMQPLLMLKQTLEARHDAGPLLIHGPNVQFTEATQFLSKLAGKKGQTKRLQIQIEVQDAEYIPSVQTIFSRDSMGFKIVQMTIEVKKAEQRIKYFTLHPEMSVEEIRAMGNQGPIPNNFNKVTRSSCFLCLQSEDGIRPLNVTYVPFEACIFDAIHLPVGRGNPERAYKNIVPGSRYPSTFPRYPGTFEHYAASIIHEWYNTGDERLKTLENALQTLGLAGKVRTKKIGDVGIEIQVGRLLHASDMVNIADAGFGVSQVMPVLVALLAARPTQLVYLEQPELHLHPRVQVALAQVLADAAKRGVRVVAETHSSLLLLAVQTLVAEGELPPELVKLHWFSRNNVGITEVSSVTLDEAGTYGDWPLDFDDVELEAESRYIKASLSRCSEGA